MSSTFEKWMSQFPLSPEQRELIQRNKDIDVQLTERDAKTAEKEKLKAERVNNAIQLEDDASGSQTDQGDDSGETTDEEIEKKIPSDLENAKMALQNLEKKSWRLIDAREGFNIYSNMKVQADQETQMLKSSISIVFSYIEILSAWNQNNGSFLALTILASTILLIANDFADQMKLYSHDGKHTLDVSSSTRLQLIIKIFASVFVVIGLFLAFIEQRSRSQRLRDKIHERRSDILKTVDKTNTYAKFLIDTHFRVQPGQLRDPILDFVNTLTNTDVNYVRQTFIGYQDNIEQLDDIERYDNVIIYNIRDMRIQYTMHADQESDLFIVEYSVTVPPQFWSLHAKREEIKRKYFVFSYEKDRAILSVSQYTIKCDEHEDDIREFIALRNVFNSTLEQPGADASQIRELKLSIKKMQMAIASQARAAKSAKGDGDNVAQLPQ